MKPLQLAAFGALVLAAGLVLLILLTLLGGCGSYNHLVGLKTQVDGSWAEVENVYQRRADLIPNLVHTVQGAANFEKSTLTAVVQARQQVNNIKLSPATAPTDPAVLQKFQQTQDQLSNSLSRLLVTVERYPELKSNENFLDLQTQLEGTENRITVARRKFNEAVQAYNTSVQSMPNALFAGRFGFTTRPYFAATAGAEAPPAVNFDFGSSPSPTPASP